jgi:hypothetical protein
MKFFESLRQSRTFAKLAAFTGSGRQLLRRNILTFPARPIAYVMRQVS